MDVLSITQLNHKLDDAEAHIDKQVKRIEELEAALVEAQEGVSYLYAYMEDGHVKCGAAFKQRWLDALKMIKETLVRHW